MIGLEKIEQWLDDLPELIPLAAEDGMQGAVANLMHDAEDTTLYNDRSAATRFSTLAYIAGREGGVGAAFGAGESLIGAWLEANPDRERPIDRAEIEQIEPEGGATATTVILTSFMAYDRFLFTMQDGARNALWQAMEMNMVPLAESGWAGIGELFD